jgi:hypothetical protein
MRDYNKIDQENKMASASGGKAPTDTVKTSNSQLADAGLPLKKGDVQKEGAKIDPRLIEIAQQVKSQVPGFSRFTAFNDKFHEGSPNSKHNKGKAFDFTINKKPTPEEGKKILEIMKGLGIDHAIDEYNNPSSRATAGHFHGELSASLGGSFDGPSSGYPIMLHGPETVLNGIQKDNINQRLAQVEKQPAESSIPGVNDAISSVTSAMSNTDMSDMFQQMSEMMEDKFGSMLSALEDGNNISSKILQYSQA